MRRAALLAISAVLVVGVAAGAAALVITARAAPAEDGRHPITEPFAYPELDSADDPAANIELLRIPPDVLEEMTAEALAWSVVNFPYFGNFLYASELGGGVDLLRPQCDALDALLRRDDAVVAVQAVRATLADGDGADEFGELKIMLLDEILAWLGR